MTNLPIHGMCVCIVSNVQSLKFGESVVRSAVFIITITIRTTVVEVVVVAVVIPSQAIPGDPFGFS